MITLLTFYSSNSQIETEEGLFLRKKKKYILQTYTIKHCSTNKDNKKEKKKEAGFEPKPHLALLLDFAL